MTDPTPAKLIKVASETNPSSLAGAITEIMRATGRAEMQAIGAGAVNQAVKGVIIARGFLSPYGIDLKATPCFIEVNIDARERTVIRFILENDR